MAVFILKDALYVQTDNASMAVLVRDALFGQTFVVRLVMHLKYKDGRKTHYASGRTFLRNTP